MDNYFVASGTTENKLEDWHGGKNLPRLRDMKADPYRTAREHPTITVSSGYH
jgi:hypothetical protein